ncbi:MAG: AbrB/MazE/SpoVT family DNA-binding domain-containing protein [Candidatus Omnitrophica bacterium]|nr:AbrB/MazE/SpoVT family DNA-binding domain-containing protein [Candidatus Omnitrophota bacterium]
MVEVAEATVKKWGSSLGIIIPKEVAEKEGIKDGEKVSVIGKIEKLVSGTKFIKFAVENIGANSDN